MIRLSEYVTYGTESNKMYYGCRNAGKHRATVEGGFHMCYGYDPEEGSPPVPKHVMKALMRQTISPLKHVVPELGWAFGQTTIYFPWLVNKHHLVDLIDVKFTKSFRRINPKTNRMKSTLPVGVTHMLLGVTRACVNIARYEPDSPLIHDFDRPALTLALRNKGKSLQWLIDFNRKLMDLHSFTGYGGSPLGRVDFERKMTTLFESNGNLRFSDWERWRP